MQDKEYTKSIFSRVKLLHEKKISRDDLMELLVDLQDCTYVFFDVNEVRYVACFKPKSEEIEYYEVWTLLRDATRIIFIVYEDEIVVYVEGERK